MEQFKRFWLSIGLRYWPIIAILIGMGLLRSAWAAILLYHAGIAAGLAMKPRAFGAVTRGWNWWLGVVSVPIGAATFFSVYLLLKPLLSFHSTLFLPQTIDIWRSRGSFPVLAALHEFGLGSLASLGLFAIYFSTIHPILEELCWREFVVPDSQIPHLRDFEFAAYHVVVLQLLFPGCWLLTAISVSTLITASWMWRFLRHRLEGLAIPVFSHAAADCGIILAALMLAYF